VSNFQAFVNGHKPKTKKELREAVKSQPQTVMFADTSAINNRGTIGVDGLRESDVIVGPCVYTKRNWYANVRAGKVI
jgi:hypothetical protein